MNFKTTLVLIFLLGALGIYMFLTRDVGPAPTTATDPTGEARLLSIDIKDVTKVAITPANDKKIVLEKSGSDWKMTEPVASAVETLEVESALKTILDTTTRGKTDPAGKGVEKPRYVVEITAAGKTTRLALGDRSPVGDHMYVRVGDGKADVVAASLSDVIEQPVSRYRKSKLIDAAPNDIQRLTILRPNDRISLLKQADGWKITEPIQMAADAMAASDLVMAIASLRASEFVAEDSGAAKGFGLTPARTSVWLSTIPASTQPTTEPASQPAGTTIRFGTYDDVRRKNIYATVDGGTSIVKVSADILEKLNTKVLDLRDKNVVTINPDQVSKIALTIDQPATTHPTTKPASVRQVVVNRHKESKVLGPLLPATTQATSQPAAKWESTDKIDEESIEVFLAVLNPLRSEKFIENPDATSPSVKYDVTVTTEGPGGTPVSDHRIRIVDPGDGQNAIVTYNDLSFTVGRSILSSLESGFAAQPHVAPNERTFEPSRP